MSDFATVLRDHLEVQPKLRRRAAKILDIINSRPSKRRTRQLARMEAHAAAVVGAAVSAIDWENIDWGKLLVSILEVLLKLLPLILLL